MKITNIYVIDFQLVWAQIIFYYAYYIFLFTAPALFPTVLTIILSKFWPLALYVFIPTIYLLIDKHMYSMRNTADALYDFRPKREDYE